MKALHGTLGRRPCVCKAQSTWNAIDNRKLSKVYPPLTYSVNRRDITGEELGMLLATSRTDVMVGPGANHLCRQNYSYWQSPEGLHHAAKLEVALRRSVATVACYTTWDVYGDEGGVTSAVGTDAISAAAAAANAAAAATSLSTVHREPQREEEIRHLAAAPQREAQRSGSWGRASVVPATAAASAPAVAAGPSTGPSPGTAAASWYGSSHPGPAAASLAGSQAPRPSPQWSKPAPPPGVPDMDWNWLLPSNGASGSSCRTSSTDPTTTTSASWSNDSGRRGAAAASGGGPPSPSSSSSSSPPSRHQQQPREGQWPSTVPASPSTPSRRKSLVGFARASGDNSLVATIYDVAVHPAVQGQGIGRRLVKLLVQQIQARSVYDIGVVTPVQSAGFWQRVAFDDDREDSTFMTFMGRPEGRDGSLLAYEGGEGMATLPPDLTAPRSSQELLDAADLGFWAAAQRSESLQAVLAARLRCFRGADVGPRDARGRAGQGGEGRVRWGPQRSR